MKLKLTQKQIFGIASKIFNEVNEDEGFGNLKDQNGFVQNDWLKAAYRAIEGYNRIAKYMDFPDTTAVRNCCRICEHVDLYRPACNLNGCDIDLECVCHSFERFKFENDEEEDYSEFEE